MFQTITSVWLNCNLVNWGPNPFRSLNGWLESPGFVEFVEKSWGELNVTGSAVFVVKEKLYNLNHSLRKWNKDSYGWVDLEIEDTVKRINKCDDSFGEDGRSVRGLGSLELEAERIILVKEREGAVANFWSKLRRRECLLIQKYRIRWCREGDLNTRFFHHLVKAREKANYIGSVAT